MYDSCHPENRIELDVSTVGGEQLASYQ